MKATLKGWKIHLGCWGAILWLASFNLSGWAGSYGLNEVAELLSGYMLGFLMAFGGYLFWLLADGRSAVILGTKGTLDRAISLFPLLIILMFSGLILYISIFHDPPWAYNIGLVFSSIVVTKGLIPVIGEVDGQWTSG